MTLKQIQAIKKLLKAARHARSLAWEVGTETEDGFQTLLEDSRGDLYRELDSAIDAVELELALENVEF